MIVTPVTLGLQQNPTYNTAATVPGFKLLSERWHHSRRFLARHTEKASQIGQQICQVLGPHRHHRRDYVKGVKELRKRSNHGQRRRPISRFMALPPLFAICSVSSSGSSSPGRPAFLIQSTCVLAWWAATIATPYNYAYHHSHPHPRPPPSAYHQQQQSKLVFRLHLHHHWRLTSLNLDDEDVEAIN